MDSPSFSFDVAHDPSNDPERHRRRIILSEVEGDPEAMKQTEETELPGKAARFFI